MTYHPLFQSCRLFLFACVFVVSGVLSHRQEHIKKPDSKEFISICLSVCLDLSVRPSIHPCIYLSLSGYVTLSSRQKTPTNKQQEMVDF